MGHYMGCGLQVENGWIGGRTVGFENDTEVAKVAKKGACVLGMVSLKRECSRFFQMEDRKVSRALPATCIAEV
jgi:hypothetical protein